MKDKAKPPAPRYQYRLIAVSSSREAGRMETALRQRLGGSSLSFFAICREDGKCDVIGDSGGSPAEDAVLREARAVAAEIQKTSLGG